MVAKKSARASRIKSSRGLPLGLKNSAGRANRSGKTKSAKKLKVLSSKTVFTGKVFRVTSDEVEEPNGVTARRDVVRHSGSIVVIAVDDGGAEPRLLLERQYRYAAREFLLEVPAGRIDPGEDMLAAAKRELIEETGYRARYWKRVMRYWASPGFVDETMNVFLARGLTAGEAQPEEDESITCKFVPLSQVIDQILQGKIHDGKTIIAAFWLKEFLVRGGRSA